MDGRKDFPRALRRHVMTRDGGLCQLCGAPATVLGHVVPHALGGSAEADNLRAECARCSTSGGAAIGAAVRRSRSTGAPVSLEPVRKAVREMTTRQRVAAGVWSRPWY